MTGKRQFVYLIRPVRPNFNQNWSEEEAEIMGRHFNYLKKLKDEKPVILAGPCPDAAFGVVIFEAESEEAAQKIMESDPAVKEKIMTSELHSF